MTYELKLKKEAILVITALTLSATAAWANGVNTFTLAGTVEAFYCAGDSTSEAAEAPATEKYRPYPGCTLELGDPEAGGQFRTEVNCDDPSLIPACEWLKPGDRALVLGNETPFGKVATHVALLLHGPREPGAAGEKQIPGQSSMFQMGLGQSIHFGGLRIQFLAVVEDSRCPEDVTCVWQGRVTVTIAVWEEASGSLKGEYLGAFDLTLGADPDPEREVADHLIRLEEVLPVPRTGPRIAPSGYTITLSVTQAPPCGESPWCPPLD